MSVLSVRSLSKRYGSVGTFALHGVSLSVRRGEIVAVVGESGCGKTTLLRLIAGLEVPTEGEVLLNGHVASTARTVVPPERRGVGIVFQDYALFPHLNVLANVMFGLQAMRGSMRQARAMETLALVGMQDYTKRFAHELSGGQQQRVALARALAPQPALLLLDEPFSNLDIVIKEQVREEVGQILRAAETTALYVVHDLEDVLSVANRIAILKSGALQQIDTPELVYQRPKDEYVARLFGSTNLLPGIPRGDGFDTPVGYIAAAAARGHDAPVTLSIRPGDLEIGTTEGDTTAAIVRQTRFRGDHQEVVLGLLSESGMEHELLLHTGADRPLHIGQVLRVRPVAGSVRVLG
ncbi:MAG: ABC transporter ATP-binding protein [Gemmatimonadetes bacterium]|nr:ABC transporter ATP-binding protein [Gemmatimonadota bacterium]